MIEEEGQRRGRRVGPSHNSEPGISPQPLVINVFLFAFVVGSDEMGKNLNSSGQHLLSTAT
jgi:hypothetical protein